MSKVPAWKRLGLAVKGEVADNVVVSTTHLDGAVVTNKMAKKLNKKRQMTEDKAKGTKKPPKRVKLPKSERRPPPEKDQLAYLRQFTEDRDNWKFSKQKQNWLLKNIEDIPESYEGNLLTYVEGVQGGARDRLVQDLKSVMTKWNDYSRALEDKVNAQLYGEKEVDDVEKAAEPDKVGAEVPSGPSKEYALRCKRLLSTLVEETIHMEGESESEEANSQTVSEASGEASMAQVGETDEKSDTLEDNLIIEEIEAEEYDKVAIEPEAEDKSTEDSLQHEEEAVITTSGQIGKGEKNKEKKEKKEKKVKQEKSIPKRKKQSKDTGRSRKTRTKDAEE